MKNDEREEKKSRLRAGMIDNDAPVKEEAKAEGEPAPRKRMSRGRKAAIAVVVLAALLLVAAAVYVFIRTNTQYTEVTVRWEKELSAESYYEYVAFGDNIIQYTHDGAVYYDSSGNEIWNQTYELDSPEAFVNGDYVVIADIDGNTMYILNTEGYLGTAYSSLPITKASISATGVTAVIVEDSDGNSIYFYDKTGDQLSIEIKVTLSGNGYPLDLSISPDGMLLMVSYVYLDEGAMQNQVVFYNFDEEGQSITDRLVGGFKDYGTSMVGRVKFLTDTYAVAFAEDRLCFYSLENTVQPELISQIDIEDEIQSIFYSDSYAGIITEDSEGDQMLRVFSVKGKEVLAIDIDAAYDTAEISGDHILLYNETTCVIYNMSGTLKYEGALSGTIEKLVCINGSKYVQTGTQVMKGITLE